MKILTTRLATTLVFLLVFAIGFLTVRAQDGPKFDLIYVVDSEGTLKSYLPAADNQVLFHSNIDTGLAGLRQIFSGGYNIVYVVTDDGLLKWYKLPNRARRDTSAEVWETKDLGSGWEQYQQIFAGGGGIIYAMRPNGKLYWFRHHAYQTGGSMESPGAWEGPKEVGSEWTQFKRIFPGGDGIVYVVAQDNRLKWLRHIEYYNGAKAWEGPKDVGGPGWGTYKQIFSTGGGVIYAVTDDNKLLWQREIDYAHGVKNWEGPIEIKGLNWGDLAHVFALLRESPGGGAGLPVQKGSANGGVRETVDEFGKLADKLPSDEIRCRGYSRAGGSAYVFFNINSRPSSTGETIVTYEIAYTPGTQAAGLKGEGLRPGECAWANRPIGDNGPFRIRFETVANAQLKQQLHGSPVDRSSKAAESYPDVNTIPVYLKGETHYWRFAGISNSGKGYFQATGNSFWKPQTGFEAVINSPATPANINKPKRESFPDRR